MKTDIYDFVSEYDIEDNPILLTRTGKFEYEFYICVTRMHGIPVAGFYKARFCPEVSNVYVMNDETGDMIEWKDFSIQELLGSDGIGIIVIEDHLGFTEEFEDNKQDSFDLECLICKFTIKNTDVDMNPITKDEYEAMYDRFHAQKYKGDRH